MWKAARAKSVIWGGEGVLLSCHLSPAEMPSYICPDFVAALAGRVRAYTCIRYSDNGGERGGWGFLFLGAIEFDIWFKNAV